MEHEETKSPERRASSEKTGPKRERETKDDGRYIIFYTFEGEED